MTLPYTPHDIFSLKCLPSFVIEAINHLLLSKSRNAVMYFTLNEVHATINAFNINKIPFNQSWYDFTIIYNEIGWNFEFNEKDEKFNQPYWCFSVRHKSSIDLQLRLNKVLKDIAYYDQRPVGVL